MLLFFSLSCSDLSSLSLPEFLDCVCLTLELTVEEERKAFLGKCNYFFRDNLIFNLKTLLLVATPEFMLSNNVFPLWLFVVDLRERMGMTTPAIEDQREDPRTMTNSNDAELERIRSYEQEWMRFGNPLDSVTISSDCKSFFCSLCRKLVQLRRADIMRRHCIGPVHQRKLNPEQTREEKARRKKSVRSQANREGNLEGGGDDEEIRGDGVDNDADDNVDNDNQETSNWKHHRVNDRPENDAETLALALLGEKTSSEEKQVNPYSSMPPPRATSATTNINEMQDVNLSKIRDLADAAGLELSELTRMPEPRHSDFWEAQEHFSSSFPEIVEDRGAKVEDSKVGSGDIALVPAQGPLPNSLPKKILSRKWKDGAPWYRCRWRVRNRMVDDTVSISRLVREYGQLVVRLVERYDSANSVVLEVERVVARHGDEGFLVRWKGYPDLFDSITPRENLGSRADELIAKI